MTNKEEEEFCQQLYFSSPAQGERHISRSLELLQVLLVALQFSICITLSKQRTKLKDHPLCIIYRLLTGTELRFLQTL